MRIYTDVQLAGSYTALENEVRTAVDTDAAAFHLNRKPQTLRSWACFENGPIRPLRINGRLAWPVKELRQVLGCRPFAKTNPHFHEQQLGKSISASKGEQE